MKYFSRFIKYFFSLIIGLLGSFAIGALISLLSEIFILVLWFQNSLGKECSYNGSYISNCYLLGLDVSAYVQYIVWPWLTLGVLGNVAVPISLTFHAIIGGVISMCLYIPIIIARQITKKLRACS